jgi:hypothetical protein
MSTAPEQQDGSLESLAAQVADEFLARQKRGEQPDVEEYAARYPQCATVIREVLAALCVVGLSAPSDAGLEGGDPPSGVLGDFRIIARWVMAAWAWCMRRSRFPLAGGWR